MAASTQRVGSGPPIMVHGTEGAEPSLHQQSSQFRSSTTYDRSTRDSPNSRRDRRDSTWERGHRHRGPSPSLTWHLPWNKKSFANGRVLLIDYVAREHTEQGRRKIVTQEFQTVDELRKFYRNENLCQQAALRVIHVQNASWALRFLFNKFNINASDDLVGTNFGRWAKYEKPQRRGGKPVLNGKTFRAQRDPWRGISRAAFGCDYLRHYVRNKIQKKEGGAEKMMELNCYDEMDQPTYGWDVFVQRLSVYVQMSDGEPSTQAQLDPYIKNPYKVDDAQKEDGGNHTQKTDVNGRTKGGHQKYVPKLETLDNGSTIIIIESSQSGSVEDTLIGARQEIEQRWRRLTFYLPREDTDSDEKLALECMDFILRDVFKALAFTWEKYINICETHTGILEDKIYDNPADESRAPELWTNSSLWLKVERLMYLHTDIIKEMRNHLHDLLGLNPSNETTWLSQSAEELDKLTTQFQEGVVKPTANLSDLMYKSVGIRDARHSLQLGLSMWRLSWITFIFLPLTFVCGFFGMNVDTFESNPPIKWFFISAAPLLIIMMASWYMIKHAVHSQKQDPLRRGVYENLYYNLSTEHPHLWTRKGPRQGVIPVGRWADLKWQLLQRWFSAERTLLRPGGYDPGDDQLGAWSRLKRSLARRWLKNLPVMPTSISQAELGDIIVDHPVAVAGQQQDPELSAVQQLVNLSTPVAVAEVDVEVTAASRVRKRRGLFGLTGRLRSLSPVKSNGGEGERPESRESGVMVEEKGLNSEDERSGGEEEEKGANMNQSGGKDGRGEVGGTEVGRDRLGVPSADRSV